MAKLEMVTLPKAMYEDLESKATRLNRILHTLASSAADLKGVTITAVITSPPTGVNAKKILTAVTNLVRIASE